MTLVPDQTENAAFVPSEGEGACAERKCVTIVSASCPPVEPVQSFSLLLKKWLPWWWAWSQCLKPRRSPARQTKTSLLSLVFPRRLLWHH